MDETNLINHVIDEDELINENYQYGFKVGNIGYIYEKHLSMELIRNLNVCPVSNTKSWMLGIVNIRGNLIPIYDLNLLFNKEKTTNKTTNKYFLILDKNKKSVGFVVERPPEACGDLKELGFIPENTPKEIKYHITESFVSVDNKENIWLKFDKELFFSSLKNEIIN